MSKLKGLLKRERQITKCGYNLNLLERTNMARKPVDSNGRSYLQSPAGGLKPKKRADVAIPHIPGDHQMSTSRIFHECSVMHHLFSSISMVLKRSFVVKFFCSLTAMLALSRQAQCIKTFCSNPTLL